MQGTLGGAEPEEEQGKEGCGNWRLDKGSGALAGTARSAF